jgi:hypothetical protein
VSNANPKPFVQDECSWNPREDYRKPLSRQQVEALRTRVADLERMLHDNGLDPGKSSITHVAAANEGQEQGSGIGSGTALGSGSRTRLQDPIEQQEERSLTNGPGDLRDWSQSHLVSLVNKDGFSYLVRN